VIPTSASAGPVAISGKLLHDGPSYGHRRMLRYLNFGITLGKNGFPLDWPILCCKSKQALLVRRTIANGFPTALFGT
jgi:hypothetical protein